MRRALLLGLLMMPGWAGACSPAEAPAHVVQASAALRALPSREVNCPQPQPARHWTNCELYAAAPAQVLPLLQTAHNAKAVSEGESWHLTTSDGTGISLLVSATTGGTLVNFQRQEWADDQLQSELWKALDTRLESWKKRHWWAFFQQPSCAQLGLRDNEWYKLESCRLTKRPNTDKTTLSNLPIIEISIRWAVDKSVPLHQIRRFGYTANGCSLYEFF